MAHQGAVLSILGILDSHWADSFWTCFDLAVQMERISDTSKCADLFAKYDDDHSGVFNTKTDVMSH